MIIPSSPLDLEISFASCQSTQNVTPTFAPGVNPRPLRLQYGRIENSQSSVATNEIMKMATTIGGYLVSTSKASYTCPRARLRLWVEG